MKPSSLYLSLDGYAASGILSGQDRLHNETSLQSTEYEIEGRSGFSLCTSYFPHFMYTPYFGYGKFWGISHFLTPPETEGITLRNEFRFFAIGSNIRFILGNHLTLDFDARIKTITDARRKVRGPVSLPTLSMGEEFQYEADFPFTYHATFRSARLYYSIVPFWRQRHYGAFATSVRINNREKLIVVEDTVYQQVGARFLFGIDY